MPRPRGPLHARRVREAMQRMKAMGIKLGRGVKREDRPAGTPEPWWIIRRRMYLVEKMKKRVALIED